MRRPGLALALALIAGAATSARGSEHFLQDQSALDLLGGFDISDFAVATDIELDGLTRLDRLTVWLFDGTANDNGLLASFSGTLSWAIFLHDLGPDPLLYSGSDAFPELTHTGLAWSSLFDVVKVRIDLDGRPLAGPGTVWLVLHEGPWGSAFDSTGAYWSNSATMLGESTRTSGSEQNPGPPWSVAVGVDPALALEGDPPFWTQGSFATAGAVDISFFVAAAAFTLPTSARPGSLDAWLSDDQINDDGQLGSFGGTLSWAIHSNAVDRPGTLLLSGQDSSPLLTDTGLQDSSASDIVRVRIRLSGRPSLAAGTYWLALHEGNWLSPYDDSSVYWVWSTSVFGLDGVYSSSPTAPGDWAGDDAADYAFVLVEDELFASGFDAGATCAWSTAVGGATCP
jgi:hypothetical protein